MPNSHYKKFTLTGEVKCIDDEIPFDLPKGWEWCRIKDICQMQAGKNISASEISEEKNLEYQYRCIGGNGLRGYVKTYNTEGHFSIVGRQGVLCGCLNIEVGRFYATEHAVIVDSWGIITPLFMYYILTALNLNQYSTATAQPGLSVAKIIDTPFPLPPLAEQQRIVAKIEELMPLVEQYGRAQSELEALNSNIREQLKKSVLQYAIEGKLVPQYEKDGTAEDLLREIQAEKQRLYAEGKLKKKDLAHSSIFRGEDNKYYEQIGSEIMGVSDEIPFVLPCSWQWVRFGQIVRMSIGKTPARGDVRYWSNVTRPWVSISDMVDYGHINNTKEKISNAASSLMGSISPVGSLLMTFKLTVGRTSILNIDAYHNEAIITIYPFIDDEFALRDYLFYTLPILSNMGDSKDAIKGKTLNSKSLNSLLIPLPPLKEQRHIIKRLEELYAYL